MIKFGNQTRKNRKYQRKCSNNFTVDCIIYLAIKLKKCGRQVLALSTVTFLILVLDFLNCKITFIPILLCKLQVSIFIGAILQTSHDKCIKKKKKKTHFMGKNWIFFISIQFFFYIYMYKYKCYLRIFDFSFFPRTNYTSNIILGWEKNNKI